MVSMLRVLVSRKKAAHIPAPRILLNTLNAAIIPAPRILLNTLNAAIIPAPCVLLSTEKCSTIFLDRYFNHYPRTTNIPVYRNA